jgi:hypothetical protein
LLVECIDNLSLGCPLLAQETIRLIVETTCQNITRMKEPKQTGTKTVTIDGRVYTVRVFGDTTEDIAKAKKREKHKRHKIGRTQKAPDVDEANWSIEDRSGSVELPSKSFARRHVRSGYWKNQEPNDE